MATKLPPTDYRYRNCAQCTAYCRYQSDSAGCIGSVKIDHEADCPQLAKDKEFSAILSGFMKAREADYAAVRGDLAKAYPNANGEQLREAWDRLRKGE
jgi:hypothetical protein